MNTTDMISTKKKLEPTDLEEKNLLFKTDGYKVSHWMQFPEGTEASFYYIEARGGIFDEIMIAGMHYITAILEGGISRADVIEAHEFYLGYFGMDVFNLEGWLHIAEELDGNLPIRIRAVPEGLVVPVKNVIATVETLGRVNAHVAGYLETMMLRAQWYASTVATISFENKKVLYKALLDSCDLIEDDLFMTLYFRLIDFGARGVSSGESAATGGLPHLYSFRGSDTVEAVRLAQKLFGAEMAGNSIPAREHSTTTCYLREGEYEAFMNSVNNFGGGTFAIVIDSYSTKKALIWLLTNKEFLRVLTEKGGICILRPDSGLPVDMVVMCLEMTYKLVGGHVNRKGYKVLDPRFRVLQGDGVDNKEILRITTWCVYGLKFSQENFNYGMGGGLLQHCDRDWSKWAMKMSAIKVYGEWRGVYKSPETDLSKKSKEGRLDLILDEDGNYKTIVLKDTQICHPRSVMRVVFLSGQRLNLQDLPNIRALNDAQCKEKVTA